MEFDQQIEKLQDRLEQLKTQSSNVDEEISKENSLLLIEMKKYEGEI